MTNGGFPLVISFAYSLLNDTSSRDHYAHISDNVRLSGRHRYGRRFAPNPSYQNHKIRLSLILVSALNKNKVKFIPKRKVWLFIKFYKPSNRFDCINSLKLIADAIKKSIMVDDNYFSVGFLDWEVDKLNPRIEIMVAQEDKNEKETKLRRQSISKFQKRKILKKKES